MERTYHTIYLQSQQIHYYGAHINGIFNVFIVDESKAPRLASLVVIDHLQILHRSILGEEVPQLFFTGIETKSKHTQHSVRTRVELCVCITSLCDVCVCVRESS